MLSTNRDKLVMISVMGSVDAPRFPAVPWTPHFISCDGRPSLLPAIGGIVYNVRVGDPALGWAAESIEPGVGIRSADAGANRALKVYSCIGNDAVVMSGRAKGAQGTVSGKSGRFADHVIIDFAPDSLEMLAPGDKVLVKALGRGLALHGLPGVLVKNISPRLLEKMGVASSGGRLQVPVVATLPAEMMGAGSGLDSDGGCLQIQTGAPGMLEEYELGGLRIGDVVAIRDYECSHAPGFLRGAVSIGIVCHGDSVRAGFGPGMTIVMTASGGEIEPETDADANIARMLGLGAFGPSSG